jgi:YggT family protein
MGSILGQLIGIYKLIVFANVILSWIVHLRNQNTTVRQLYLTTSRFVNPVLDPIRQLLRPLMGNVPFDISPIVLILLLTTLRNIVHTAF